MFTHLAEQESFHPFGILLKIILRIIGPVFQICPQTWARYCSGSLDDLCLCQHLHRFAYDLRRLTDLVGTLEEVWQRRSRDSCCPWQGVLATQMYIYKRQRQVWTSHCVLCSSSVHFITLVMIKTVSSQNVYLY